MYIYIYIYIYIQTYIHAHTFAIYFPLLTRIRLVVYTGHFSLVQSLLQERLEQARHADSGDQHFGYWANIWTGWPRGGP